MKIVGGFIGVVSLLTGYYSANAQKNISEASLVYDMVIQTGNNEAQKGPALTGASTAIYLKGNNNRTETVSSLGKEIIIYNSKSDNAVILKEFSGQKLMITLDKNDWRSKNKMYSNVTFELTNDFKTIGLYNTRRAIAKMPDGKTFDVYYTPDLVPANKEYDVTFKNLPGLPIQYELESGKMKVRYNLAQINYDPVQVSLFDFPTSGYRIMTYDENQKLKKGNE